MAKSARARSTCAAGALSERLRRVSSWRSSAVSGRRGSFRWRDMAHLGARGSPHTIPVPTADDPLVRDLRRLWAQALAIALVIAGAVATLVMAVGSSRSLDETRIAYYER